MKKLILVALLAMMMVFIQGFKSPKVGLRSNALDVGLSSELGIGGESDLDVNLDLLGQDLIAGEFWTPVVDFSGGTKYYFDPDATAGGDGTIDDPFQAFGAALVADNIIEHYDENMVLQNGASSPVVGAGDVCVLLGGEHGEILMVDMHFTDYLGVVGKPGEQAIFGNIDIQAGSYIYFEWIEADPANTRNSGYWPVENEHILGVYDDYDDAPWQVSITRDVHGNQRSHHIILNRVKLGISSGDIPAGWDWEDWNSNAVGGVYVYRSPYVQVQKSSGVGLSHSFNIRNEYIAPGHAFADSTEAVNKNNIFNNTFKHLNGDGIYVHDTQGNEIKGNSWTDFYLSNDDHVVALDAYFKSANNIYDGNKIVITSTSRPDILPGYEADCVNSPNCEGRGLGGVNLIGGNTGNIVRNNVIHGNEYGLIQVRSYWGSSYDVEIYNNTLTCDSLQLWDDGGQTAMVLTVPTLSNPAAIPTVDGDTVSVDIHNNICSEVRVTAYAGNINDTIESHNSEYALDFTGAGFSYWAPEANSASQNVSLTALSENVNAGIAAGAPLTDYSGNHRPCGGLFDIGAYEYQGDCDSPAAPLGLSSFSGDTVVELFWDPNTEPDLSHYKVYRGTTSGALTLLHTFASPQLDYTDNAVVNGTTYFYAITAVDASGNESDQSAEISDTPNPAALAFDSFTVNSASEAP